METFASLPVDLNNLLEEDPYFSLSQFDLELQQQAQAALLQESWQDFEKYLPIDNQLLLNNLQAQPIFTNELSSIPSPPLLNEKLILDNKQVKQEYASPESLPHSPQIINDNKSLDFMNWNSLSATQTLDNQGKVPIQRLKSNNIITNAVNAALNNPTTTTKHKKTAHNAIERRYRNNINDRITELKNAVPALLYAKPKDSRTGKRAQRDDDNDEDNDNDSSEEFLDGVAVATKLNKATILRKATEYINHLKKTGDDVRQENETLQRILNQLPGGSDILQRYHLQKQHREQQAFEEQMREREARKLQEQRRKAANRKRTKYNSQPLSDDYESSPDPVTPPSMTNRVFMAVFMSITFFSTSPVSQYQNHHYASQPESYITHTSTNFLTTFFNFNDTWSALRTLIFIICIGQLLLPYFKYMLFPKLIRVNKTKRSRIKNLQSLKAQGTLN